MTREEFILWLTNNWYLLAVLALTELMPFLPTKSNGVVQFVINILRSMGKGAAACFMILILAGCTTLNVSMNTTAGDNNKPAVKTDAQADQNISPQTTATIPLK